MAVGTLFCFVITWQITTQDFLTRNGHGLPKFKDYKGQDNDRRIGLHRQAIIPTYKFNCCGRITEWGLDVFDNGSFTLDLQVWRPSPTMDDFTGTGCYSLVGNNRFTSVSVNGGVAIVTPSPQDYSIHFQSGDVLGFYVEDATRSKYTNPGVVILTSPSWLYSESVWFASIAATAKTSQSGDCPYSVGSDGVLNTLTRAAPVISISTTRIPCSPSPSINTQTSTRTSIILMHTPSANMATSSNSTTTLIERSLSNHIINVTFSSQYSMSPAIPSENRSITTDSETTAEFENKAILIVSVAFPTLFLSLIIIVTFAIIILLRSGKRKQSEPSYGERVSQQGISNQTYFEPELQLQTNKIEPSIEIVPADNGQSVIYHCIGPSTPTAEKAASISDRPETHHYFELEALPRHHVYEYADTDQLSLGRGKDEAVANSGKSMPVYEDIILCSQKFQDSKGHESESKAVDTENGY